MSEADSTHGPSILESIWEQLDGVMRDLMRPTMKRNIAGMPDLDEIPTLKGKALGLATALAILMNPYKVDVDAIRSEAVARYKASL